LITPIAIAPVTAAQAKLAREAYRDFGKGTGHPAQLNFGDCFVFALAQETSAAILFKGRDFALAGAVSAM
jgi:ribonuclease VapC